MKKIASFLLVTLLALNLSGCVIGGVSVKVDGKKVKFKDKPVAIKETVLVSIEDSEKIFNIPFTYDEKSKTITASNEDYSVEFEVGSTSAKGTRLSYTLDVSPKKTSDGVVMIPLDFSAEQLGYEINWTKKGKKAEIKKLNLVRDVPATENEKAAIARARQLTEFKFTPVKNISTSITSSKRGFFEAGVECKGFPYSGTEEYDKFFCENVSFETFLSALSNPDGVFYEEEMYYSSTDSTYYGIVCNGLVRYCLGINERYSTNIWLDIPGINKIANAGKYTANDIKLCDSLWVNNETSNHVAIITGILRDESGTIKKIEVSEAIRPTCRRRLFDPDELLTRYSKYSLCRYENIEKIPLFDEDENKILFESGIDKQKPMIAVDYGDKSNYFYGYPTIISSFAEGANTVQIYRNGTLIEEIAVNGYQKLSRDFDKGYYVIKLANTPYSTEFCVCKPEITHTVSNGIITVNASSGDPNSEIFSMDFRQEGIRIAPLTQVVLPTDQEKATGVIQRAIPNDAKTFKISFKNKYGVWTHTIISI